MIANRTKNWGVPWMVRIADGLLQGLLSGFIDLVVPGIRNLPN